jgi:biofilm PGA synthesis lipoprotein PgaB
MRRPGLTGLILACCMSGAVARDPVVVATNAFTVLCFHEVRDDVRDYPDPFAVDAAALVRQFTWLRGNGYVPVSLDAIVAARAGGKALPARAVLLSFDDAYLSFHTRVYPLLREFGFPALLGVVGAWIDKPPGARPVYGEKASVFEASFPTWAQLREMTASGLVEIASHTYDMHHGVSANPQGNLQPAATARNFDAVTGTYESDASWRARVRADLARSATVIERETGRRPRAVVWPYGSYNGELVQMAAELGMPIALTLDDDTNTADVPLAALRRLLIAHNPSLAEFAIEVRGPLQPEPVRVVQVSLDAIHDADPAARERKLSSLLDRIEVLKPTHVYLQASTDLDGDGVADAAYFPNRHLPLRVDLFNRVAWQIASRVDVKVFAAMPVSGLRLPEASVTEIFEDLARHANFEGLLFMDGSAEFTQQLAGAARRWRALKVARWYADEPAAAADPGSDQVVVTNPASARPVAGRAGSPRTVYLLDREPLALRMRALQLQGALDFGYAADDVLRDSPALSETAPAMSLRVFPLAPASKEK